MYACVDYILFLISTYFLFHNKRFVFTKHNAPNIVLFPKGNSFKKAGVRLPQVGNLHSIPYHMILAIKYFKISLLQISKLQFAKVKCIVHLKRQGCRWDVKVNITPTNSFPLRLIQDELVVSCLNFSSGMQVNAFIVLSFFCCCFFDRV